MPARLRPTAPIAADAILVGDPGRALMLAQELLREPKMSNHARGLWGYGGRTETGSELTIQSTGMGGPSAAVVLRDLAELGVRRAVRVGTCASLGALDLGEIVVVTAARPLRDSLAAPHLEKEPPNERALADGGLTAALRETLGRAASPGTVVSLDVLHRSHPPSSTPSADVVDMQTAAVLATAAELKVATAALLVVTERGAEGHLSDEDLETAAKRAGAAAAASLSSSG